MVKQKKLTRNLITHMEVEIPIAEFLEETGHLPPGIHNMTLAEVRSNFGTFNGRNVRPELFKRLKSMVENIRPLPFIREIIVDGSFVTKKLEPGDIDIVISVDPPVINRIGAKGDVSLPPLHYNALRKKYYSRTYGFDVFVLPAGSEAYDDMVSYFGRLKEDPSMRKGIVRLKLS